MGFVDNRKNFKKVFFFFFLPNHLGKFWWSCLELSSTSIIADKEGNRTKTDNSNNRQTTSYTHSFYCAHLLTHHLLRLQYLRHNAMYTKAARDNIWVTEQDDLHTELCLSGTLDADIKLTNKSSYIMSRTKTQYNGFSFKCPSHTHTHAHTQTIWQCIFSSECKMPWGGEDLLKWRCSLAHIVKIL